METSIYTPEKVFPVKHAEVSIGWPGDFEGRVMLALILEAQATHRKPKYLDEMIRLIPEKLNKEGYLGPLQKDYILEQQLAGHGWFLRALCEYYQWKKDTKVKGYIQKIIQNLALPTRGHHSSYPIDPANRNKTVGEAVGITEATLGRWKLSSDIGCNFIFLDGIVQAYQILPSPELKNLIEEMLARFLEMDLQGMNAQTHATLTGLRGILRYYSITHQPNLLKQVKLRYDLYRRNAMTSNYENFNWFGRPDWTEPCGIVDSYMLAVQLWQFTNDPVYLEDAHHIYYNGIANTQRENGGFGLSNCVVPNSNALSVNLDEAYWCCTMRGGEGIANAIRYNYFIGHKELVVPFFNSSEATFRFNNKEVTLKQSSTYPFNGKVSFQVVKSTLQEAIYFKLATPSWTKNHKLTLNGTPVSFKKDKGFIVFQTKFSGGSNIEFSFDQESKAVPNDNPKSRLHYTFNYGPLVLGYENNKKPEISFKKTPKLIKLSDQDWILEGRDIHLSPIYHLMDPRVNKASGYAKQILFQIKK